MIGNFEYRAQILFRVRSAEGMHFAGKFLVPQACFVQAAGAGASQITINQRSHAEHREGFQRQQDARSALLLNTLKDAQVFFQRHFVHHEAGRGQSLQIEPGKALHGD